MTRAHPLLFLGLLAPTAAISLRPALPVYSVQVASSPSIVMASTAGDLNKLTKKKLQAKLKAAGLKSSGNKKDLIIRLEDSLVEAALQAKEETAVEAAPPATQLDEVLSTQVEEEAEPELEEVATWKPGDFDLALTDGYVEPEPAPVAKKTVKPCDFLEKPVAIPAEPEPMAVVHDEVAPEAEALVEAVAEAPPAIETAEKQNGALAIGVALIAALGLYFTPLESPLYSFGEVVVSGQKAPAAKVQKAAAPKAQRKPNARIVEERATPKSFSLKAELDKM